MDILSWDSDNAISVPSSHAYFNGALSRSISNHLDNSPIITDIPPAHPSLHLFTNFAKRGSKNSLVNFLSSTGFPLCTSAPSSVTDLASCTFDEPAAAPIPSLPVFHPMSMILSPAFGSFLTMFLLGAPAITYHTSKRLAANHG